MALTAEDRQRLLKAVVSLAAQDDLGEEQFWTAVEPALIALLSNPNLDRDLRRDLPKINAVDVIATMEDWFSRAARERAEAQRETAVNRSEIVTPIKRLGYGCGIGGLAAAVLGTASLPVALPLLAAGLALTAGGIAGAVHLRRKENLAQTDAEKLQRLAGLCKEEREGRARSAPAS